MDTNGRSGWPSRVRTSTSFKAIVADIHGWHREGTRSVSGSSDRGLEIVITLPIFASNPDAPWRTIAVTKLLLLFASSAPNLASSAMDRSLRMRLIPCISIKDLNIDPASNGAFFRFITIVVPDLRSVFDHVNHPFFDPELRESAYETPPAGIASPTFCSSRAPHRRPLSSS